MPKKKTMNQPDFPGTLGEPIVLDCIKLNALANPTDEEQRRRLELVKFAKLHHFAKLYGIDVHDNPYRYATLAIRIAEEARVPGFRVVQKLADVPKVRRGRRPGSGKRTIDRRRLFQEIERQRAQRKMEHLREGCEEEDFKFNVSEACRRLSRPSKYEPKEFKGFEATSLEVAYHKAAKEHEAFKESIVAEIHRFGLHGILGFPLSDLRSILDNHQI
jgi:hypothetical protein